MTRYGLDGPGIKSQREERFSAPVQNGPGAHPASYTMGSGSFPGVKQPGCGADHPSPPSAENYTSTPPLGLRSLFLGELYLYLYLLPNRGTQWCSLLSHCISSQKFMGSFPDGGNLDILLNYPLQPHYGPGVDSASNRNEYQGYLWQ